MIKVINSNNKNYLNKLNSLLEKRRSGKKIDTQIVTKILKDIKKNKTKALLKYEKKFSKNKNIKSTNNEINKAIRRLDPKVKKALDFAYNKILNFHKKNECKLTLVASTKEIVIPYGACSLDKKGYLKEILEKPSLNYLINFN